MKVKELMERLDKINPEWTVVIDRDENGWFAIKDVTIEDGEDWDKLVSINKDS